MPVRSPTMNATVDQTMAQVSPTLKSNGVLAEAEETNENVSREKLTNMKLMMKTFVLGALREKEQVNYFISCLKKKEVCLSFFLFC